VASCTYTFAAEISSFLIFPLFRFAAMAAARLWDPGTPGKFRGPERRSRPESVRGPERRQSRNWNCEWRGRPAPGSPKPQIWGTRKFKGSDFYLWLQPGLKLRLPTL